MSTLSSFELETKIGDIVAAHPLLARIFEHVGLDYCCGGQRSLAQSCRAKGLDPATVLALLEAALQLPTHGAAAPIDAAALSLTELADHIEHTHHAYLKSELPALLEKAERVAYKHGWRDARLAEVATTTRGLTEEMLDHMTKEETVLFPIVRDLERKPSHGPGAPALAAPIACMEAEHTSAGDAVARLRALTDGFAPAAEACNTHRALLAGLAQLEHDLHEHVHKENNILFPRALALAGRTR